MNAMTNAMNNAGIKLPSVKYRIWNWLKDHPEKTAEDITKALGMNYVPAAEIRDMELRGMLKAYSDVSRKKGINGFEYKIKRYSVTNATKYEILDKPAKHDTVKTPKAPPAVVPHAELVEKLVHTPQPKPKKTELTEAEKFAAFLEFKALMKEMK